MGPKRVYRSLLVCSAWVYCNQWRLKANVCKSAVMVFSRNPVEGEWKWGEHAGYPNTIDFACNGAWDVHIQKICNHC